MRLSVFITIVLIFIAGLFIGQCSHARGLKVGTEIEGTTSYYHRSLNGNLTANGERYKHMGAMTAAHRNMPFGTKLLVTDMDTGNSIVVRVNDRGPFVKGRVLDLSGLAATKLGIVKKGISKVDIKVLSMPVPKKSKDTLGDFIYQQDNWSEVLPSSNIYTASAR